MILLIEAVPKLFPRFETDSFLTKYKKTAKKHAFLHLE
jgi:hypothetical protein